MISDRYFLLLLIGSLLVFTGVNCEKPNAPDPDFGLTDRQKLEKYAPLTAEGKETFGCLINGKVWLPKVSCSNPFACPPEVFGDYGHKSKNFYVQGKYWLTDKNVNENVNIYIYNYDFSSDTVELVQNKAPGAYAEYLLTKPKGDLYPTDSVYTGKLIFSRFDTTSGIAAGTFSFSARNSAGEIIQITDGRFDVTFP